MAKRFIDTNLFKKGFVKQLSPEYKLLYIYLFCECDHCGIWEVELDVASIRIGFDVSQQEKALQVFEGKVVSFDKGKKWFIPQFVTFQYGKLSGANKIHKNVLATLNKSGLVQFLDNCETDDEELPNPYVTLSEEYPNPTQRVTEPLQKGIDTLKEKEKEKEKDKLELKEKEKEIKEKEKNAQPYTTAAVETPQDVISVDIAHERGQGGTQIPTAKRKPVKTNGSDSGDFKNLIETYDTFCKLRKLPTRITEADGAAAKKILIYLKQIESVKNGEREALEIFSFILDNWERLSSWQQTQTQLRQINSQLPSMIETLKQHYNGKQKNTTQHAALSSLANSLRNAIAGG